jgi:ribosome-binding protein aMBF1 (putative translation factor)
MWHFKVPKTDIKELKRSMRPNKLTSAPPLAVDQAVQTLGAHLRTARLRRNLTTERIAAKLGVDRHVVSDAERGKLTTAVAIYAGLLWAMGLLPQLERVAEPSSDDEGMALGLADDRKKARMRGLSGDF